MMTHPVQQHLSPEELIAYREGEGVLPGMEEHLRHCSACRQELADARLVQLGLRGRGGRPPHGHVSAATLAAYADGGLSPTRAQQVESHLFNCDECIEAVLSARAVSLSAEPDAVPAPLIHKAFSHMAPVRQPIVGGLLISLVRGIAESLFFPAKGQGPSDALRSEVSFKRETGFLSEDSDAFDAPERIGLLRPLYERQDDRELDFEAPADMHSRSFSLEWDMADFEVPTDVEQPPRKRFDALLGYSPAISPVLGTAYAPQLPRAVKYSLRRTPAEDGLVIKAAYDSRQPPPVAAPAQGAHGGLVFVAGGVRVTGQLSGPGPVVTAALWIADESTGTPLTKWPTVFITPDGQREESATDEQGRVEFQLGSGLGTLVLGPSGEIVLPILVEESRGSP